MKKLTLLVAILALAGFCSNSQADEKVVGLVPSPEGDYQNLKTESFAVSGGAPQDGKVLMSVDSQGNARWGRLKASTATYTITYAQAGTGDCQQICCDAKRPDGSYVADYMDGDLIDDYRDPPDGAQVRSGGRNQKCITMREGDNCGGADNNRAGITCKGARIVAVV